MASKKPKKSTVINKNDKLARELNRKLRKNKCERCFRDGNHFKMDWSHIYGRRAKSGGLRWDMDNCHLFCSTCHRWQHENPLEYAAWYIKTYGRKAYDALRLKFNKLDRGMTVDDYLDAQNRLQEQLDSFDKPFQD